MSRYNEAVLTTDNFNNPKVLKDKEAISTLLVRLILMEPGTNHNRPGMGVGIRSKYEFNNEESLLELKNDISTQINQYLPELIAVDVSVYLDTTDNLIIDIRADDTLYRFEAIKDIENQLVGLKNLNY